MAEYRYKSYPVQQPLRELRVLRGEKIDHEKCTDCGLCIKACPTQAAKGRVLDKLFAADCFSCARCLNVCPQDAIRYGSVFSKSSCEKPQNKTLQPDAG